MGSKDLISITLSDLLNSLLLVKRTLKAAIETLGMLKKKVFKGSKTMTSMILHEDSYRP